MTGRIIVLLWFLVIGAGCKKGNKTDCDFSQEFQQLRDLERSYNSNPTLEYCQASKKFMLNLLNRAEDCPESDKEEIARVKQLIAVDTCARPPGR